tara:strand:+ start:364 stop:795 length:432 start_codon:yes stop_codon:yes gene_type:complete
MTTGQKKVRFRGVLLSEDEFNKKAEYDLWLKNTMVRIQCWIEVQKQEDKPLFLNSWGLIDVPEDFVPDPILLNRCRTAYKKAQKRRIIRAQKHLRADELCSDIVDAQLVLLMKYSKENPSMNPFEGRLISMSVDYLAERQKQK